MNRGEITTEVKGEKREEKDEERNEKRLDGWEERNAKEKGEKWKKWRDRGEENKTEQKWKMGMMRRNEREEKRTEVNWEKAAVQHLSWQVVVVFRQKQQRTQGTEQAISGGIYFYLQFPLWQKNHNKSGLLISFRFYLVHTLQRAHMQYNMLVSLYYTQTKRLYMKRQRTGGRADNSDGGVEESRESRALTLTTTWVQTTEFKWNDKQRGTAALGEKLGVSWAEPEGAERDRQQAALHWTPHNS